MRKYYPRVLPLFCSIFLLALSPASPGQPTDSDSDIDIQEHKQGEDFWKYQELEPASQSDRVEKSLGFVLNKSHQFANWVDGFFDDDRTIGIKNETRLKLSYWGFFDEDDQYNEDDFSFNIRVKLPKAQKKVQLVITNDPDDELSSSRSGGVFPDQRTSDETTVGFRFFDLAGLEQKIPGKFSTSMGLGFSSGDVTFRIEPRYIYTHDFAIWSTTFLQKVRWHSRDGWSTQTRLDFDRALSKKFFLRSNNELYWDEQERDVYGYEFRPRLILSHRLSGKQALLYEWNNLFYSKPEFDLNTTALVVRYRRQVWRPWFFVEVAPQVAFRNADDWDASAGVFAKMEILLKKTDK